jgi:hypothetical protein
VFLVNVHERYRAPRGNPAGNRAEQSLAITAAAVIWMHADGCHLGVVSRLHSLAGHRNKPSVDPDSEKRSQFVRSRAERAGLGELGQRHHVRNVIGTELDRLHAADRTFRGRSDHLLAGFGKQHLELDGRIHGVGRKHHGDLGSGRDRAQRRKTLRGHIRHVRERRDRSRIA